jgi:dolichol-phosphate mannosyltransferase
MTADYSPADREAWQVPAFDTVFWLGRRHAYCVVIPVINEGLRIAHLLERMAAKKIPEVADVLIVDDGSTDASLNSAMLQARGVRGLIVKTGVGKLGAQLRCAYSFALDQGYDGIVTIDGNDKDDPEAIPRFITALKEGCDFVQASRFISGGVAENTPGARELAIRWIHAPLLSWFSGFHWSDTTQGFRAYSRKILLDRRVAPFRDVFLSYEILAYLSYRVPRLGFRCIELPTARRYPAAGPMPSKIRGFKANLSLLMILFRACLGAYNPRGDAHRASHADLSS